MLGGLLFFVLRILRPPRSTRTDTLFPDPTRYRSGRPCRDGPRRRALLDRRAKGDAAVADPRAQRLRRARARTAAGAFIGRGRRASRSTAPRRALRQIGRAHV